jgi:hypothetical protein
MLGTWEIVVDKGGQKRGKKGRDLEETLLFF